MKPVRLQFKGINSFSEQTDIDFENLTRSGIFGIFGDTGSGKSTILDCINFALYGKVERSKEKLDIINYRCDSAEVKFEFDVLYDGKRKRFSVERSLRKKSGTHKAELYEDGLCIADNASTVTKKITDILGVDAEDFRKCIALPQGEFSQFVKSQPSERIALIERLFSLSKYGDRLKERIKDKEREAEIEYQTLGAKLGVYDDVSDEAVKFSEEQINNMGKEIERISEKNVKAEKQFSLLKSLGEKYSELKGVNEKLTELSGQKSRMDELRAGLKAAPVCKTIAKTESEIEEKTEELKKLNESVVQIKAEAENLKKHIDGLNANFENAKYDERIEKGITLSAKYLSCAGKPEKLAKLNKQLEGKRAEYRSKNTELSQLNSKLKAAQENLTAAEKTLNERGAADLDKIINVSYKGAVLKEEYVNSLDYFVGLNGQVSFLRDDSDLYKFINKELKQQIEIYKDRVFQLKDFSLAEAQKQIAEIQSAGKEHEELVAAVNDCKVAVKDAQNEVNDCLRELKILERDGDELRKQADEIVCELNKVFGQECSDYEKAVNDNERNLKNLREEKTSLAEKIESANEQSGEITVRIAAEETEAKTLSADIDKLKQKLKSDLEQSGFESVESCVKLADRFEEFADAEKSLDEYDKALISLTERKKALEKTEGIEEFSKESLSAAEENKNSVAEALTEARKIYAVLEADLKKLKERNAEKKFLKKDFAKAEKQRNLIAQLKEITKGNKFMEFIANEYLYDISSLASSTLLNLTDGRYFLTYTDTFYAGDNFNCGNLRGVNTLSGGETFLVSLSLALALSQTICASLKSIEFFFLDEGFGTLDGTLVDTVMNALEKLKSSQFVIGVISHVEELKHRIDSKITVLKATESHGSKVQISC